MLISGRYLGNICSGVKSCRLNTEINQFRELGQKRSYVSSYSRLPFSLIQ